MSRTIGNHPAPTQVPWRIVVSCEHGGNQITGAFASFFTGQAALLASHRGWDPGAQQLGEELADALGAPFFGSTHSRLLIDLNRSIGHPKLHAPAIAALPPAVRRKIASTLYFPHRDAIAATIAHAIDTGANVLHIASHSFTPILDDVVRQAEVAWLYDPRRPAEKHFAGLWRTALLSLEPTWRLRCNYPYQGVGDGLTTSLRRRHDAARYLGIELEVNQAFVQPGGAGWDMLRSAVITSCQVALQTAGMR